MQGRIFPEVWYRSFKGITNPDGLVNELAANAKKALLASCIRRHPEVEVRV